MEEVIVNCEDSEFVEREGEKIISLLKSNSLEALVVRDKTPRHGMEEEVIRAITTFLQRTKTLVELGFNTGVTSTQLRSFVNCSSNARFFISETFESDMELLDNMAENQSLRAIHLNHVIFDILRYEKCSKDMLQAICSHCCLQTLKLNNMKIRNIGSSEIAKILKNTNPPSTIKELYLWGNKIGNTGAIQIANSLQFNTSLEHLDLSMNRIKDDAAKRFAFALKRNSTLTHLDLSSNLIEDSGLKELAASLLCNDSLQHLNLFGNFLSFEVLVLFAIAFSFNFTIKCILFNIYDIMEDDAIIKIEKLLSQFANNHCSLITDDDCELVYFNRKMDESPIDNLMIWKQQMTCIIKTSEFNFSNLDTWL